MKAFAVSLIVLFVFVSPILVPAQAKSQPKVAPKLVITTPDQPDLKWVPCGGGMPEGCELAVLRGDPTKGPSEVFIRAPKSYVFPPHWHTSAERITWFKGKATVTVEGVGEMPVNPVAYIYFPAKKVHSARCGDQEPCVMSLYLDKPFDIHLVTGKK